MNTLNRFTGAAAMLLLLAAGLHSQETRLPMTLMADAGSEASDATSAATAGADASSSATPAGPSVKFLGFKSKESFHRFSGWMSGGLLLAAGVVGGIHLVDMMSKAHDWRDSQGIEDYGTAGCVDEIQSVWNDSGSQALRWTHVGLLAAGETFYLANAFTGVSLMGPLPPGWSKAKIHRYAFFAHASLMVAEGVLGFMASDALKRGDHGQFMGLLEAHAAIGIAIPVVILGAGAIMSRPRSEPQP